MTVEAAHIDGKCRNEDAENGGFEHGNGLEEGENQRQRGGDQRNPPGAIQPLPEAARGDDKHEAENAGQKMRRLNDRQRHEIGQEIQIAVGCRRHA
ncbi:hypothetical protein D3C78_1184160 [compost metagenome]